jgi:hypothetical protein
MEFDEIWCRRAPAPPAALRQVLFKTERLEAVLCTYFLTFVFKMESTLML